MAVVNAAQESKPLSAAICENEKAATHGQVLHDGYDASQWLMLGTCRNCPHYQAVRP
jgi:hypothetical protein